MKSIDVVGAVIYDKNSNKFLATMRNLKKHMGGLWEFPGGKVEDNEDPEEALMREIKEELSCHVAVKKLMVDYTHNYPDFQVRLRTYLCIIASGDLMPTEHEQLKWVEPCMLKTLHWAEADIPTVEYIIKNFCSPSEELNCFKYRLT